MSKLSLIFRKSNALTLNLPIDTTSIEMSATLKLHSISINYNIDRLTSKYYASISYCENPEDYKNQGMKRDINIDASNWEELINKVSECLGGVDA